MSGDIHCDPAAERQSLHLLSIERASDARPLAGLTYVLTYQSSAHSGAAQDATHGAAKNNGLYASSRGFNDLWTGNNLLA